MCGLVGFLGGEVAKNCDLSAEGWKATLHCFVGQEVLEGGSGSALCLEPSSGTGLVLGIVDWALNLLWSDCPRLSLSFPFHLCFYQEALPAACTSVAERPRGGAALCWGACAHESRLVVALEE